MASSGGIKLIHSGKNGRLEKNNENKEVQVTFCDRSFTTLFLLNLFVYLKLIMTLFVETEVSCRLFSRIENERTRSSVAVDVIGQLNCLAS